MVDIVGNKPNRVTVCPLGVEGWLSKVSREPSPKISRFLFFGRLVVHKGIFDALEALSLLYARGYVDWEYRMVGQGDREPIMKAARDYGISENVWVGGAMNDKELRRELVWADLAIMPSHAESSGLSIAEAQAAGLPVVAYHAGSVPEVVEDGKTGFLAPLGDQTFWPILSRR